jgi:porphobilinogen deaminase
LNTRTQTIRIATRGSALALAQANAVLAQCRAAFPELDFELRIIKTTGDKLQKASMANPSPSLPKGLFTKELEVALLGGKADLAVHSLKDLPTDLPKGLVLGAVGQREDVRDAIISREGDLRGAGGVRNLPRGGTVATSSTRRKAQLLAARPDLQIVEIRGNVPTRLQKLAQQKELSAILLAAAGLRRLGFQIGPRGRLTGGPSVPPRAGGIPAGELGLRVSLIPTEIMLPCVGQAAVGIEIRQNDPRILAVCAALNHHETMACVTAERAFLHTMGGGCQSPVAAHAQKVGDRLEMRAVSFREPRVRRAMATAPLEEAERLGREVAVALMPHAC